MAQRPSTSAIQAKGISDIDRDNLFEPFYTTHQTGTGLGLYIIRELCELNNASVDCLPSEEGAHFRVVLASAQDMAAFGLFMKTLQVLTYVCKFSLVRDSSMSKKALIIDDEADIRELIAMSLDRIGLDTYTAANLMEARNLLEAYQFDVCLTDMKLPDGNGVEFVRYATGVQPGLPVAVITAHGNMDAAVDAMKNGAFDFVSKPVDLGLLRDLVAQAIKVKRTIEPVSSPVPLLKKKTHP